PVDVPLDLSDVSETPDIQRPAGDMDDSRLTGSLMRQRQNSHRTGRSKHALAELPECHRCSLL
ncbi:MAG: hypothetical protein ACK56I_16575, partial [bacterium]